ncbi:MAG: hypothetical protein ACKVOR_03875, partial [Flavobacteriales bacterium]
NFVFSGFHFNDRARGLQQGMQQTDASPALSNAMAQNFSSYITRQGNASPLPILFVNSTRMQDGKPGVFSTIKLHSLKTERIDICAQMNNKQDVTLACAVVNGARFPYLSPAGAMCDTSGHWQYFVDGGYFDNSGAGIVHELLHEVLGLMETPEYADIKQRVVIRVVHITNSEWGPGIEQGRLHHVNTMKNDLAAPFITLLGSYSMQTSVNDFRLKNYVQDHEGATDVYLKIPLLKEGESGEAFTMNWVISKHVRDKMDSRLDSAGFSTASQVIKKDFR